MRADNIFFKVWRQYLVHYASQRLPSVSQLSEHEKIIIFKEDAKKSVAILLYEFAMPNGTSTRYFDTSFAISKELMCTSGFKYCMKKYLKNTIDSATNHRLADSFRYIMTPKRGAYAQKSIVGQFPRAAAEHFKWVMRPSSTQLFLGSYIIKFAPINEQWIEVFVSNKTSRNSFFMHIPKNVEKPETFGTTQQVFCLKINLDSYR